MAKVSHASCWAYKGMPSQAASSGWSCWEALALPKPIDKVKARSRSSLAAKPPGPTESPVKRRPRTQPRGSMNEQNDLRHRATLAAQAEYFSAPIATNSCCYLSAAEGKIWELEVGMVMGNAFSSQKLEFLTMSRIKLRLRISSVRRENPRLAASLFAQLTNEGLGCRKFIVSLAFNFGFRGSYFASVPAAIYKFRHRYGRVPWRKVNFTTRGRFFTSYEVASAVLHKFAVLPRSDSDGFGCTAGFT